MIKNILFLFVLLNFSAAMKAQVVETISSAEISFIFVSKNVDGSISGFESTSTFNYDTLADSTLKGSVAVETIKTGNFLRDWSLKGGKYFDTDTHPKITFESTEISQTDDGFMVRGKLTIKGTTKTVTMNFIRKDNRLIGASTLYSSDFGIEIKDDREENEVRVKLVLNLKS